MLKFNPVFENAKQRPTDNVQKMIDPEICRPKMDMSIKISLLKAQRTLQKRKRTDCKNQKVEGVH